MSSAKPDVPGRRRRWVREAARWISAAVVLTVVALFVHGAIGQEEPGARIGVPVACGVLTLLAVTDLWVPRMGSWVLDGEDLLGTLVTAVFTGIAAAGAFGSATYALGERPCDCVQAR